MSFRIDKQTISDLELFADKDSIPSIFGYYNRTVTQGGSMILHKIFRSPFPDIQVLEDRKKELAFFVSLESSLELNKRHFDYIEYYLAIRRTPLRNHVIDAIRDSIANKLKPTNDYYTIKEGIIYLLGVLDDLRMFLLEIKDTQIPESLRSSFEDALEFIESDSLGSYISKQAKDIQKLRPKTINRLDYFFRSKHKNQLRETIDTIYRIDVLQTMASLVRSDGFSIPEYIVDAKPVFQVEDGFHPLLHEPVSNNFGFRDTGGLCFLTGPNMSGKSTFLKTIALFVYLSHLGIPVPARSLKTSIFSGLVTSINISDSISQGHSHFYAEVRRVKEVAMEIGQHQPLMVVLDELFRGTNVKDAFDGTLMVIRAMSEIKGSCFLISSHILEVAEQLSGSTEIDFRCFESVLVNGKPEYDYKIKVGISTERTGMQIIRNENIEAIFSDIITKQ